MFELLEAYALRTPLFYLKECALGLCDGQDNANLLKEGSELITIDRPAILNIGSSETIPKLGFRVKRFPQLGKPGGSVTRAHKRNFAIRREWSSCPRK